MAFISRKQSRYLYGVAVIAMVFHHLFCCPERLGTPYIPLAVPGSVGFEVAVAVFCKLCVAMFSFLSGYGLTVARSGATGFTLGEAFGFFAGRIRKFYPRYLLIVVVFVTMGCALGVFEPDFASIGASLLGLSTRYNGEWWYIRQYLVMMLLFPLLFNLLGRASVRSAVGLPLAVAVGCLATRFLGAQWVYTLIFIEGMLVARFELFERLRSLVGGWLRGRRAVEVVVSAAALILLYLVRSACTDSPTGYTIDCLLIVPLMFSLVILLGEDDHKFLGVFGGHSTSIWLTHTFLIYYFFQPLVMLPRYSVLIFVWALAVCLFVAMAVDLLFGFTAGLFRSTWGKPRRSLDAQAEAQCPTRKDG